MERKTNRIWKMVLSMAIVFSLLLGIGYDAIPIQADASASEAAAPKASLSEVTANNEIGDIQLKQTEINATGVTIHIPASVLTGQQADSVKITAKMYYGETVTRNVTETVSLESNKEEYTVDFKDFGKYTVETEYLKGNETVAKSEDVILGIIAEEYNIAVLNGTFPVSLFSLSLWGDNANGCITQGEQGNAIPTFAIFERLAAWDWNFLPEDVYKLPLASDSDYADAFANWGRARELMTAYVKDLYEISPQAFFHLYTVDNYVEHLMIFFIANQIPESQYDMVLLSDGSGTYSIFNNTFQEDDGTKYQEMLEEWESLKTKTREAGSFDWQWAKYGVGAWQCLQNYAAVAAADENVEWWMARPNNFSIKNTELLATVKQNCTTKNLSSMLTKVGQLQKTEEFRKLYHLDNDMFTEANESGKPVMVILGTNLKTEKNFKDYAKIVMEYYGDSYEYYYKGHPATPTNLYPSKQQELQELGIKDVDSTIPAELIMFFFPDIYLCGYDSSTYTSVESAKMACSLFGWTKEAANSNSTINKYSGMMEFFISPLSADHAEYGKFCEEEGHQYYLLEYNDTSVQDISVYDVTENVFKHYKKAASSDGDEWSIAGKDNLLKVTMEDVVYGDEIKPTVENPSSGRLAYEYKGKDEEEAAYSKDIPTEPGEYILRVKSSGGKEYKSAVVTVSFSILKKTPVISKLPTASAITQGQSLSTSKLTGGEADTEGTFQWKAPDTKPSAADSNKTKYTVLFTPADTKYYDLKEVEITVEVLKKNTNTPGGGGTGTTTPSSASPEASTSPSAEASPSASSSPSVAVTPSVSPSAAATPSVAASPSVTAAPSMTAPASATAGPSAAPPATPSAPSTVKPTAPPAAPSVKPSAVPEASKKEAVLVKKAEYKVTNSAKKTVTYIVSKDVKASSIVIPAEVKVNGIKHKVTAIAKDAFKNNKKLKKAVIGKNIKTIGKNAFYKCKNTDKITIQTTHLTKKSVGANAFKGLSPKVKIKVPAKKLAAYKKILKQRGVSGKKQKIGK